MTINYQFADIIHLFFRFRKPFSINNHQKNFEIYALK